MAKRIAENVWKLNFDSNIYFLNLSKKILIDTGDPIYQKDILASLEGLVKPEDIDIVILTHFHYDHSGNAGLFRNAQFYCSKDEYDAFMENPYNAVLDSVIAKGLGEIHFSFLDDEQNFLGLRVIKTPGHTKGSICLFFQKERMLFSGDTLFFGGNIGRYDFPTSSPGKYKDSLKKIESIKYDLLCPGHDY